MSNNVTPTPRQQDMPASNRDSCYEQQQRNKNYEDAAYDLREWKASVAFPLLLAALLFGIVHSNEHEVINSYPVDHGVLVMGMTVVGCVFSAFRNGWLLPFDVYPISTIVSFLEISTLYLVLRLDVIPFVFDSVLYKLVFITCSAMFLMLSARPKMTSNSAGQDRVAVQWERTADSVFFHINSVIYLIFCVTFLKYFTVFLSHYSIIALALVALACEPSRRYMESVLKFVFA
mmetsp:Transcript_47040/g.121527  ORF Transcript_47040/g.121527 Transcript_47040/m.121527 type:complete len:232 (-) Transcript_47040:3203-3898(-)